MRTILLLATAAVALTACNQGVSLTNASPEEVAKASADAGVFKLKPGRWEHRVELIDGPALPAGVPKEVAAKMSAASTVTSCMTEEQAGMGARQFLETPVVKQMQCNFTKAEIGKGTISSEMSCTILGLKTTTRSSGTYTATDYSVDTEQTRAGSDKVQKARTTGKWVGECDGTEGKAK